MSYSKFKGYRRINFRQYCVGKLGEELGESIADLYINYLDFGGAVQKNALPLGERRQKHVDYMFDTFVEKAIVFVMNNIKENRRKGLSKYIHLKPWIFENNVKEIEKKWKNKKKKERVIKKKTIVVIPSRKERVHNDYKKEIFNWIFECTNCKNTFTPWDNDCPNCSAWIDWDKVDAEGNPCGST